MGRDVETCARMLEALAPGFDRVEPGSLGELEIGVAWLEFAEPLVRARVRAAAELFPRRRSVAFPLPQGIGAVFIREAAESHRGLFPEHADAYGENVRAKRERCLRVTDAELEAALRRLEEYRERAADAVAGLDLLVTPTLAFVAPPAIRDDLEILDAVIRFTYPFNALGWPALALPCGRAEHGLPASLQLVAPVGNDANVIAAGSSLELALATRPGRTASTKARRRTRPTAVGRPRA
jgi:Asp-tRNA(Asn)/Glu-tRNA(Gln) amidotransferase A subunit family amidase